MWPKKYGECPATYSQWPVPGPGLGSSPRMHRHPPGLSWTFPTPVRETPETRPLYGDWQQTSRCRLHNEQQAPMSKLRTCPLIPFPFAFSTQTHMLPCFSCAPFFFTCHTTYGHVFHTRRDTMSAFLRVSTRSTGERAAIPTGMHTSPCRSRAPQCRQINSA